MTIAAIRGKLRDYIDIADEKKVKAIYTMLEGDIKESAAWWEDKNLLQEFDEEYNSWKKGNTRGYATDEIVDSIKQLKSRRNKK